MRRPPSAGRVAADIRFVAQHVVRNRDDEFEPQAVAAACAVRRTADLAALRTLLVCVREVSAWRMRHRVMRREDWRVINAMARVNRALRVGRYVEDDVMPWLRITA